MPVTARQTIVFVAGLAIGLAAAWAVFGSHGGKTQPAGDRKAAVVNTKALGAGPVTVAADACAFDPVVPTAASDDGRVQLQASLSGRGPKDIEGWLLEGKEAVAAGRQRDAEADFLMACRAAEQLGDGGVLPQAEAMYHLGRHYAGLAAAASESRAGELWKRAEGLYSASLKAFDARYGQDSDKTRFAAKGLAEVQAHAAGGEPALAAAARPAKAAVPAKAPETQVAKVAPPAPAAARVEPSRVEPPKAVAAAAKAVPAPKAVAEPKPAPDTRPVAEAKPREPEPQVAVVKPAAPKPRPPEPRPQAEQNPVMVEPPASASGNATGHVAEPASTEQ